MQDGFSLVTDVISAIKDGHLSQKKKNAHGQWEDDAIREVVRSSIHEFFVSDRITLSDHFSACTQWRNTTMGCTTAWNSQLLRHLSDRLGKRLPALIASMRQDLAV